jgi:hypothetical protein
MKKTKIILWCVLITIALAAVALVYFGSQDYDFIITQKQINDALLTKFPISKSYLKIFQVTYSNPNASLLPESNRIKVSMDVELVVNIRGDSKKYTGNAVMTAGLGYRYETKQFFLSNPVFEQLTVHGIPPQFTDKATEFATRVAREHLQQITIYTLRPTDVKKAALKLLLKNVRVEGDELHVALGL